MRFSIVKYINLTDDVKPCKMFYLFLLHHMENIMQVSDFAYHFTCFVAKKSRISRQNLLFPSVFVI